MSYDFVGLCYIIKEIITKEKLKGRMNIEAELKKDGIEITKQLDTLKVNSIAMNISKKICSTFSEYGFNQNDLNIK